MRACFLCAKEIPIERRNHVFCSLRCELMYQQLERRTPAEDKPGADQTAGGRPRDSWPGMGGGEEKF